MSEWSVAEAKAKLSEVIAKAQQSPQRILSRGKKVAVVISAEDFERLRGDAAKALRRQGLAGFLRKTEELKRRAPGGDLSMKLPLRKPAVLRSPFADD